MVTLPLQLVFVISFVILFLCVLIFPLVMYLYLCRFLYLRMMREGDFCLVGGDTAATIWGQYFSEIRGPVRFTKYFTTLYNIFQYFTIWGKYLWGNYRDCRLRTLHPLPTDHQLFTKHYLCTIFFPWYTKYTILAQYSSHNTQMQRVAQKNADSPHIN